MNLVVPEFAQAIHYTELRGGEYRFELLHDCPLAIPVLAGCEALISFRDHKGKEWALLDGDRLIIRRGYAWNGASPKWWLLWRWVGTPDFEPTRLATLFHDVCFQFIRTQHWPLLMTLPACNELFQSIMQARNFRLAGTYYHAVRRFGGSFAGKYPRRGEHSVELSRP